ncbi:hypothetical protein D3C72_2443290 [compost metagenome]
MPELTFQTLLIVEAWVARSWSCVPLLFAIWKRAVWVAGPPARARWAKVQPIVSPLTMQIFW